MSRQLVSYADERKAVPVKRLEMEEVYINNDSVFAGHGYMQYVEMRQKEGSIIWYRMYVKLEGCDLEDAVAFAYGDSLGRSERTTRRFLGHR